MSEDPVERNWGVSEDSVNVNENETEISNVRASNDPVERHRGASEDNERKVKNAQKKNKMGTTIIIMIVRCGDQADKDSHASS